MDFSDLIQTFKTGTYTVTRTAAASYGSDGRSVISTESTFAVDGAVFPVGARELMRLPEGLRTKQLLAIVTVTELKTQAQGATEGDTLPIDGATYAVQHVEPWAPQGNFWWSVCAKLGD